MKKNLYYVMDKRGRKKYKVLEEDERNLREYYILKKHELKFSSRKISSKELLNFFIRLKLFVENKYSLYEILDIFKKEEKIYPQVLKIKKLIKEGKKLHIVFRESGLPLKEIDIAILRAGEESGNILVAFDGIERRLAAQIERKKKINKILTYPSIVITLVVSLLYFLGEFILPNFIKIFQENNISIPEVTKIIIYISDNILFIISVIIGVVFLSKKILNNQKREILEIVLKMKCIRSIINNYFICSFLRMITILIEAGLSFSQATLIIIESSNTNYYNKKLKELHRLLVQGREIYEGLDSMKIFDFSDLELIKSGEASGKLTEVFNLIYLKKNKEMEERAENFLKLLEPLTILIIGLMVGFIFIGIYLPILGLMDGIN